MKKILVFGHLPKFVGGKQSSGLAVVMWFLAKNMQIEGKDEFQFFFVATDIHVVSQVIEHVNIIGWNKKSLIKYFFTNPHLCFYYFIKALKMKFEYNLKFSNIFLKFLFYDSSIKIVQPNIIHLHGCDSVIFFELFNFNKFKKIATIHGIDGQDNSIPNHKAYKKMEHKMTKLDFEFVAFVSNDIIKQWKEFYGNPKWPMYKILNAYDSGSYYYIDKKNNKEKKHNSYTIASIGSISELKGQKRVLSAISTIRDIEIKYICIGKGKESQIEELKEYARAKKIHFDYLGYKNPSEIRKILQGVNYMILPSSSEGFGLVFLESIACGVPVILPKHLPIVQEPDLLTNENSILLEDESLESIAEILKKLNHFKYDRDKVAKTILSNNWNSVSNKYIQLLKSINR